MQSSPAMQSLTCDVDCRKRLKRWIAPPPSEWSTTSFTTVIFRSADLSKMILQHLHDIMQRRFSEERTKAAFSRRNKCQRHQGSRTMDHCWRSGNKSSWDKCTRNLVAARRKWPLIPNYRPFVYLKTTKVSRKRTNEQKQSRIGKQCGDLTKCWKAVPGTSH